MATFADRQESLVVFKVTRLVVISEPLAVMFLISPDEFRRELKHT
jgi:hypothetical protein